MHVVSLKFKVSCSTDDTCSVFTAGPQCTAINTRLDPPTLLVTQSCASGGMLLYSSDVDAVWQLVCHNRRFVRIDYECLQ